MASHAHLLNRAVGEYRVVGFLGAGGMGEVYRAEHSKIGRAAAVKVLTQATSGAGFVERFFNEARIQASLQHPNIATVYDFLEVGGQPCIIMEYVDGQTLADRVQSYGALPLAETVFIFQALVEAIDYIHAHGIIHRDIKSNNVKISSAGQVKLLDFGLAKGQMTPGLTAAGSVIGTLQYLSPEQLRGGSADKRADIWALGVVLYEMATGRMPFESETLGDLCDRIDRVSYTPPAQLNSGVPREVAAVIMRCLKKQPAERYQTAGELLRDARKLSSLVTAPPRLGEEVREDPATASSRRGLLLAGGVAAALVAVVLVVVAAAYMAMSSAPDEGDGAGRPASPAPGVSTLAGAPGTAGRGAEKSIEVNLTEGRADVYRDGQLLGQTPYKLGVRVGERVRLTLKRAGYKDEPVDFTVGESKRDYAFTMTR